MESARRGLIEALPALQRLALSYAPAAAREPTLALFALDTRLAGIVRSASEPIMAQLRLAWWREQLGAPAAAWPLGEPLLGLLRPWDAARGPLAGLVDGWEELTAPAPLPASAIAALAEARGGAFAALAELLAAPQDAEPARQLGTDWGYADLAGRISDAGEREAALALARGREWRKLRLSRALRPLAVLHGLARRGMRRGEIDGEGSAAALLAAVRLGLLGR